VFKPPLFCALLLSHSPSMETELQTLQTRSLELTILLLLNLNEVLEYLYIGKQAVGTDRGLDKYIPLGFSKGSKKSIVEIQQSYQKSNDSSDILCTSGLMRFHGGGASWVIRGQPNSKTTPGTITNGEAVKTIQTEPAAPVFDQTVFGGTRLSIFYLH